MSSRACRVALSNSLSFSEPQKLSQEANTGSSDCGVFADTGNQLCEVFFPPFCEHDSLPGSIDIYCSNLPPSLRGIWTKGKRL